MKRQYMVICREHGQIDLGEKEYDRQLWNAHDVWRCPECHEEAMWDDIYIECNNCHKMTSYESEECVHCHKVIIV